MKDNCPKCHSFDVVLVHKLKEDLWNSRCKKCDYESKPTKNYDDAWHWKPEGNKPPTKPQEKGE